jgi:UDP-glucuronate decarboxylase
MSVDVKAANLSDVYLEDVAATCAAVGDRLQRLGGKTVLVAGAGGFLPAYMVDTLLCANDTVLSRPCRLICVDNFATSLPGRLAHLEGRPDCLLLRQSITEPIAAAEPLHYVIHGASIPSPPVYRQHPLETIDVNVGGTRNLLELARQARVASFLYVSSSEVYGDPAPDCIPTPETYLGYVSFTGPRACYSESKRLAETLCAVYYRQFQVPVKVARVFNVYGPRQWLGDGRVIPDLLRDAFNGRPLGLYSDGRPTRSFCYVADAAAAMLLLLLSDEDGEAFNVGSDEEITIDSLAHLVNELFGGGMGVDYLPSPEADYLADDPQRRCPDLRKVKAAFSWAPRVPLREGLIRTIRSYKEGATP